MSNHTIKDFKVGDVVCHETYPKSPMSVTEVHEAEVTCEWVKDYETKERDFLPSVLIFYTPPTLGFLGSV